MLNSEPNSEPGCEVVSRSPEETVAFGRDLAERLTPPVLVLLSGELGSGKTTLTKGIINGLGAGREEEVTSPTFTLVHVFDKSKVEREAARTTDSATPAESVAAKGLRVYHVDLYRIESFADLETLALEDALSESAVIIIEWPERFSLRSDWPRVEVKLEHLEGDTRRITIAATSIPGKSAVPRLTSA